MSIYETPGKFALPHARRIDKLVCAMHQDRLRLLALEADAGFFPRSICPVVVTITRRLSFIQRVRALFTRKG